MIFMTCQTLFSCFILSVFFQNVIYSQEAEKLYHDEFSKLTLVLQPSILNKFIVSDESSTPSLGFDDTFSKQFGFYYNFAQSKNVNFKTGVIAKEFSPRFHLNVSNEDLASAYPKSNEGLSDFSLSEQFVLSIPFKTEYFYKINDKLNLVAGLGINLDLRTGSHSENQLSISVLDKNGANSTRILRIQNTEPKITGSSDVSVGLNYKTKFALFQLEGFYNTQILSYAASGVYYFSNLDVSANKTGVYTVTGNYYGLSLQISPKKGWLKRNTLK
jgi:hypothetical protein